MFVKCKVCDKILAESESSTMQTLQKMLYHIFVRLQLMMILSLNKSSITACVTLLGRSPTDMVGYQCTVYRPQNIFRLVGNLIELKLADEASQLTAIIYHQWCVCVCMSVCVDCCSCSRINEVQVRDSIRLLQSRFIGFQFVDLQNNASFSSYGQVCLPGMLIVEQCV